MPDEMAFYAKQTPGMRYKIPSLDLTKQVSGRTKIRRKSDIEISRDKLKKKDDKGPTDYATSSSIDSAFRRSASYSFDKA